MSTAPSPGGPTPGLVDRLLIGWDRFWFTPAPPTLLGLLRICCGVVVLYVQIVNSLNLDAFLGEHAWFDLQTATALRRDAECVLPSGDWEEPPAEAGGIPPQTVLKSRAAWSIWFHVTDPATVERVHAGMLVVTVLFTLGLWTRVTAVLTWLAFLSCLHRMEKMVFGMDMIANVVLICLMLGPCGAALSLDNLLARFRARRHPPTGDGSPAPSVAANFSLRLLQVHLCIVYLLSGLGKVQGPNWWNGTALWDPLVNYELSLVRHSWYDGTLRWLIQDRWRGEFFLMTGAMYTLAVEIGFPFLVWHRSLRRPMIVAALLLHLGIAIFMGLYVFSLIMATLVLSFLPPQDVDGGLSLLSRVGRGLAARLGRLTRRQEKEPSTLAESPPPHLDPVTDAAC